MKDSEKTEELLALFKYFRADTLKNEQTQLTKAANKIRSTATGQLQVLFTEDEQNTLLAAATLLSSLKERVEHAKEIKERDEARRANELKENIAAARAVVDSAFPASEALQQRRDTLLWAVYLARAMVGYGGTHENYRSNRACWHQVSPEQLGHALVSWFDAADAWQTAYIRQGKLVCTPEERRQAPHFQTVDAFFLELRNRLTDILESELNSYKAGFAARFDDFQKTHQSKLQQLGDEKADYLAHFSERLSSVAAGQRFMTSLHAVFGNDQG